MDEIKSWAEYVTFLWRWVVGTTSWEAVAIILLVMALGYTMLWYNSSWHIERAMSKRKIQARHNKVREIVQDSITGALEAQHIKGVLKREEVDYQYKKLREAGFKELGTEPSFGKPWYYGPAAVSNLPKLKSDILTRLWAMGPVVREKMKKLRRRKSTNKIEELRASIRKKAA